MSYFKFHLYLSFISLIVLSCEGSSVINNTADKDSTKVEEVTSQEIIENERIADVQILRYEINGFDQLTLDQKKLVYYLNQAGLSGRDIIWDQNYRHNLAIRNALENIVKNYEGDQTSADWDNFMEYTKRIWFSNGIHHHYSSDKFIPEFSQKYFEKLLADSKAELEDDIVAILFDPKRDAKRVSLDPTQDLMIASATNFYSPNITETDVDDFYKKRMAAAGEKPVEFGLNSKLTKGEDGVIREDVWKVGGMYNDAIVQIVFWLEKAKGVAESTEQEAALGVLIDYFNTGDLQKWSDYNVAWTGATNGDIDYILGFIEVYGDPKGMRGSYESIIQVKDFEASATMAVMADNVQWFEDHSSIMDEHKKNNVKGVSYKVVNVAGESGDASPSTPIGVNLPNNDWIRADHGSKSVSLGNIVHAYNNAGGEGITEEFAHDQDEIDGQKAHGVLSSKLFVAMHEVIGHASGQLNPGIGTPKETLKNYASTLEEARADLVALYFIMDEKLVELELMESIAVGKTAYDGYIRNGLLVQLRRLELGDDIAEAHMRNRQLVASWAFEKGKENNVIEEIVRDGNTFYNINDYEALRVIFGDLLKEIQRIKSEGDYKAGKLLVENYGVKVDLEIHEQVLTRSEVLNLAPYNGFVNPVLVAITNDAGEIQDIEIKQVVSFQEQMLSYSKEYGFLTK